MLGRGWKVLTGKKFGPFISDDPTTRWASSEVLCDLDPASFMVADDRIPRWVERVERLCRASTYIGGIRLDKGLHGDQWEYTFLMKMATPEDAREAIQGLEWA